MASELPSMIDESESEGVLRKILRRRQLTLARMQMETALTTFLDFYKDYAVKDAEPLNGDGIALNLDIVNRNGYTPLEFSFFRLFQCKGQGSRIRLSLHYDAMLVHRRQVPPFAPPPYLWSREEADLINLAQRVRASPTFEMLSSISPKSAHIRYERIWGTFG